MGGTIGSLVGELGGGEFTSLPVCTNKLYRSFFVLCVHRLMFPWVPTSSSVKVNDLPLNIIILWLFCLLLSLRWRLLCSLLLRAVMYTCILRPHLLCILFLRCSIFLNFKKFFCRLLLKRMKMAAKYKPRLKS